MTRAEAFVALYEAEAKPVLVFLARRTLDAEVAVDLTAETGARRWRGRGASLGYPTSRTSAVVVRRSLRASG
jgi:hypothetical protein